MSLRYSLLGCLLLYGGCSNIDDAAPSKRNSFIHFYEAAYPMEGVNAESVDAGYVVLCNKTVKGVQSSIIIQTDKNGEKIADDIVLPNGISHNLKITANGYYVIGDSIKNDSQSNIYSARLFKVNPNGEILKKLVITNSVDTTATINYHGGAITTDSQNALIVLGTYKKGLQTEKPFLIALDPTSFDTLWTKNYDIIDLDYVNSKSVHVTPSGRILWASALLKDNQNFSRSYVSIPYVKENSTFENFSQFGELTDQQLYPNDIQPAASAAFGYGVIGTYASTTGEGKNIFFIRVDQFGAVIAGSERYFDGVALANSNNAVGATVSSSDDTGDAIISTTDGGFILGGSMQTTPLRGNGGTDILLIKIDNRGNVLWNKIFGGIGNETVSSIRETDDGGLLICGSNDLSGLSSAFIMKTDKDGELKD